MIEIRKSEDRGIANFGWLYSRHTFSFGHYYDPRHTGFGPLLVINDDQVQPGQGFGTHGHRDMEIISSVLDGVTEEKASIEKYKKEYADYWKDVIGVDGDFDLKTEKEEVE